MTSYKQPGMTPLLDIDKMSCGDALHTLKVYEWITAHKAELEALASQDSDGVVSAKQMQRTFHRQYTELEITRFLPVTISLFTDEDMLGEGLMTEPSVLLSQPFNPEMYIVADHFNTVVLGEVVSTFGIAPGEVTWRDVSEEAKNAVRSHA